jgi:translation initiation factor IF-1
MTSFTITTRKVPRSLHPDSFNSLWRPFGSVSTIPADAMEVGRDVDGHPVYAVRVRYADGSVVIGHVSRSMKQPVVSTPDRSKATGVNPQSVHCEVLLQIPGTRFVEQLQDGVPVNAVPVGFESGSVKVGKMLYLTRATVSGKSVDILKKQTVPGVTGEHLKGATVVSKGGLGIIHAAYEITKNVVPFEVSAFIFHFKIVE